MLTFKQIIEKIDHLEEANILLAALELRVFSILEQKTLSGRAVANKARSQPVETEILLNALVAMGALFKTNGLFKNTSETYKHLCDSSPNYKRGMVRLRSENRDEWANMLNIIRSGRVHSEQEVEDNDDFRWDFTHAMHERSSFYSTKLSKCVTRKPVGRLLDLGGGPGSYSVAILKKDKKATATLFDRPVTLEVAKKILEPMSVYSRFSFLEGDLFKTDYGSGYDTILFSNILHIYNPIQNRLLFKKIHRALEKGGRFILVDYFLKEDKTAPYDAALFSLTMLMFTETGKTYTFKETETLLKKAGFGSIKRFNLDHGASLLEAVKV
jgi:ubiquinone/menaquinone biosynthesis C-methylase UbiE